MSSHGRRPAEEKSAGRGVRVLLFATARTAVGERMITVPVGPGGATVRALVASLGSAYPRLVPVLAHSRFFLDGHPVEGLDQSVKPGAELAVHPPYGGG